MIGDIGLKASLDFLATDGWESLAGAMGPAEGRLRDIKSEKKAKSIISYMVGSHLPMYSKLVRTPSTQPWVHNSLSLSRCGLIYHRIYFLFSYHTIHGIK